MTAILASNACGHPHQQLCTGAVPRYLSVPGRIQEAGLRSRYGCSGNVRNAAGNGRDLADTQTVRY